MTFTGIFDIAKWWDILSFAFGIIAAICIATYTFPQLVKLLKTKNSNGISISMFIILVVGDFFFILQCFISLYSAFVNSSLQEWIVTMLPVGIANIAGFTGALWTLCIKAKNALYVKKLGITEKEYCERVAKIINLKNSEKKKLKKLLITLKHKLMLRLKKWKKK